MRAIHLGRDEPVFPFLRQMVEQGAPDGPATIYHDGKPCLAIASLHDAACLTLSGMYFVPWVPSAREPAGPRMIAALEDYMARHEAAKARAKDRAAAAKARQQEPPS